MVDLHDEVVEELRVDGLRERIATVVGCIELEVLVDELGARLDLALGECFAHRVRLKPQHLLSVLEVLHRRREDLGRLGLGRVECDVAEQHDASHELPVLLLLRVGHVLCAERLLELREAVRVVLGRHLVAVLEVAVRLAVARAELDTLELGSAQAAQQLVKDVVRALTVADVRDARLLEQVRREGGALRVTSHRAVSKR